MVVQEHRNINVRVLVFNRFALSVGALDSGVSQTYKAKTIEPIFRLQTLALFAFTAY